MGLVTIMHAAMADEEFCKEVVRKAVEVYGCVRHLVNNAFAFTAKALDAETKDRIGDFQTFGPFAS